MSCQHWQCSLPTVDIGVRVLVENRAATRERILVLPRAVICLRVLILVGASGYLRLVGNRSVLILL